MIVRLIQEAFALHSTMSREEDESVNMDESRTASDTESQVAIDEGIVLLCQIGNLVDQVRELHRVCQQVVTSSCLRELLLRMDELVVEINRVTWRDFEDSRLRANTRRVVGGLAAGSAGIPTSTPSVVGVPTGPRPSIFADPVSDDDNDSALKLSVSVPLGNTYMNLFYMCRATLKGQLTCGLYFPHKLWRRRSHTYYCGIGEREWAAHTDLPFSDVQHIGCGAKHRPFRYGSSMVCEFNYEGLQLSVLADPMPVQLSMEIKKVQASWVSASLLLTIEELARCVPRVYPKHNRVEGLPIPCVGRFPVEDALRENWPMMGEKAWWDLALEVAQKDNGGDGGGGVVG